MKPEKLSAMTKQELLAMARKMDISGRSQMSKDQLVRAIGRESAPPKKTARTRPAGRTKEQPSETESSPRVRRRKVESEPVETRPTAESGPTRPAPGPKPAPPARDQERRQPRDPRSKGSPNRQPSHQRGPRDSGHQRRRGVPEIDPAMKLSRVEEIRASSPSRRGSGPGHKGGPRGNRQAGPRDGRRNDRRDGRYSPQTERGHGRDRHGNRRDGRGPEGHDRRGGGDHRSLQAREHLRHTGEARRRSPYTPQYERDRNRDRDRRRIEAPSPAPIPSRLIEASEPSARRPSQGAAPMRSAAIPEKYGIDRLVLMVRDPYWLHAYWEVTDPTIRRAKEQLGEEWDGHRWILRVHLFPKSGDNAAVEHFDIDLNPDARNWYLRVPHPDRAYEATIGLITRGGTFYPFAKSERVQTPRASASDIVDDDWNGTPDEAEEIYRLSGGSPAGGTSAELVEGKRAGAHAGWFSGMLGSMGSGAMQAGKERGFWFQVNTELVVYGATEPDAKLTVQGRAIDLRPDGTFTLRLQLPDGVQEIPCTAISADGISERTITPVVRRQTSASENELAAETEREQ